MRKAFRYSFILFFASSVMLFVLAILFGVVGALNSDGTLGAACGASIGLGFLSALVSAACFAGHEYYRIEVDGE